MFGMQSFSHSLVVGGTGMLTAATRHVATQSETLTLVARRPKRLDALDVDAVERVAADYHATSTLIEHLEHSAKRHGAFDFGLTWIHSSADQTLLRVADMLAEQANQTRLIDVQSSGVARPGRESERHRYLADCDGLCYQRVVLGFVLEDGASRWLTHDEISAGVLDAIESGEDDHTVGVVEPWERRP